MDRVIYRIRVCGLLGSEWSSWFEGLRIAAESGGETSLTGELPDQTALHGVLARIRDLGLDLVSVETLDADDRQNPTTEV